MTYALTDIVGAAIRFRGEAAQQGMVVGYLLSGAGGGVIQEYYRLLRPGQTFKTALSELPYGKGPSSILDKSQIDVGNDHISGFGLAVRFKAQNLLSQRFAHSCCLTILVASFCYNQQDART
jgi:hypothetical protein